MTKVFDPDTDKKPLRPTHPARAWILLKQGKAVMCRRCPLTIILKYAVDNPAETHLRMKIDPGTVFKPEIWSVW
ncbi:MAG: hypothetical protein GX162_11045 [Firmicutes bacterium]|nr:hypothetical protein [Bacillota bacterium]